jgi:hypothetical protein
MKIERVSAHEYRVSYQSERYTVARTTSTPRWVVIETAYRRRNEDIRVRGTLEAALDAIVALHEGN